MKYKAYRTYCFYGVYKVSISKNLTYWCEGSQFKYYLYHHLMYFRGSVFPNLVLGNVQNRPKISDDTFISGTNVWMYSELATGRYMTEGTEADPTNVCRYFTGGLITGWLPRLEVEWRIRKNQ